MNSNNSNQQPEDNQAKRPNLETITYLDKEYKISNELKDTLKQTNNHDPN